MIQNNVNKFVEMLLNWLKWKKLYLWINNNGLQYLAILLSKIVNFSFGMYTSFWGRLRIRCLLI
jgi:hypothetical protein